MIDAIKNLILRPQHLPLPVKFIDPKTRKERDYVIVQTANGKLLLNAPNTPVHKTNQH